MFNYLVAGKTILSIWGQAFSQSEHQFLPVSLLIAPVK